MIPIGLAIKYVREQRGLSIGRVAIRMKCHASYVYKVESGYNYPTLESIDRVSRAIDIEPWKLVRLACKMRISPAANRADRKVA